MEDRTEQTSAWEELRRLNRVWPQLTGPAVFFPLTSVFFFWSGQIGWGFFALAFAVFAANAVRRRWRNPALTPGWHNWIPKRMRK